MVCGQGSSGTGDREEVRGTQARHSFNNSNRGPFGATFPASEPQRNKDGQTQERNPSGPVEETGM